MTFDENGDFLLILKHFRQLLDSVETLLVDIPAAGSKQQFVVHRDIHLAIFFIDIQPAALETLQRVGHLIFQGLDLSILLRENSLHLLDTLLLK